MRRIQLISLKKSLERAKGFEPSTPTLARSCSLLYSIGRHQRRQRPSLSRALAARRVPERDRHGAKRVRTARTRLRLLARERRHFAAYNILSHVLFPSPFVRRAFARACGV